MTTFNLFLPFLDQVMRADLGDNWKENFANFNMKPFAAASIGQVHRATLPDGTLVAVKVQYPGVAKSIESDIKNLLTLIVFRSYCKATSRQTQTLLQ